MRQRIRRVSVLLNVLLVGIVVRELLMSRFSTIGDAWIQVLSGRAYGDVRLPFRPARLRRCRMARALAGAQNSGRAKQETLRLSSETRSRPVGQGHPADHISARKNP
jgi:hypothetical protein